MLHSQSLAILSEAIRAAELLELRGIKARVLSLNSVKPLDTEIVFSACEETNGIIVIEEHAEIGGLAGAVAESCMTKGISPGFFYRVGIQDEYPTIVGDQDYLRDAYGLTAERVVSLISDELELSTQG